MADSNVESFVRTFLTESATPKSVRDMLKKSQHTKQQLNSCLYRLLKNGEVKTDGNTPPRWELNKEFIARDNNGLMNKSETRDDIVELLEDQSMTAKDLAKKLDIGVSIVNSILYELEKQKAVKHTTTTPPVWSKYSSKDAMIENIITKLESFSVEEVQRFYETLNS